MLSWALLASDCPGGGRILRCVPSALCSGACAVGFALPAVQPPLRSRRPSPSELLRVQPARCSPLGSSAAGCGALPQAQVSASVPGSLRVPPPLLGSCSNSCECLSALGDW